MAINQYTFFIVPKKGYADHILEFNNKINGDIVEDNKFWENERVACDLFEKLENLLPKNTSWDEDLIILGKLESTCLKIFCNSSIISVTLRVDFTLDYEKLLSEIIDICIFHELLILDENLSPAILNTVTIRNIIQASYQYRLYYSFLDLKE